MINDSGYIVNDRSIVVLTTRASIQGGSAWNYDMMQASCETPENSVIQDQSKDTIHLTKQWLAP
jgi:hypothetical protein